MDIQEAIKKLEKLISMLDRFHQQMQKEFSTTQDKMKEQLESIDGVLSKSNQIIGEIRKFAENNFSTLTKEQIQELGEKLKSIQTIAEKYQSLRTSISKELDKFSEESHSVSKKPKEISQQELESIINNFLISSQREESLDTIEKIDALINEYSNYWNILINIRNSLKMDPQRTIVYIGNRIQNYSECWVRIDSIEVINGLYEKISSKLDKMSESKRRMNKTTEPENSGTFIVVSDFHSMKYPLNKIKNYYINEYEHIYILGDATDRGEKKDGTGGIEILLEIMDLSKASMKNGNQNHGAIIHYVPGNHDKFLYDYAQREDENSRLNIEYNGGSKTIEDINTLKRSNPERHRELLEWLGSQPIQQTHTFCGQKYAMAHAFFDMVKFKENPNYGLKDININAIPTILWYRKSKDNYDPKRVTSTEYINIIGHTPSSVSYTGRYDLKNGDGERVTVHCVDGGVAFEGEMLKYVGGEETKSTQVIGHKDTSPKRVTIEKFVEILGKYNVKKLKTKEKCQKEKETYSKMLERLNSSPNGDYQINFGKDVYYVKIQDGDNIESIKKEIIRIINLIDKIIREFTSEKSPYAFRNSTFEQRQLLNPQDSESSSFGGRGSRN